MPGRGGAGPVGWREDWQRRTIFIRWNASLTKRLQQSPISYDDYRQQVQAAAVRAKPATLAVLESWLGGRNRSPLATTGEVKFAERSVLGRLGQQRFRADVLRAYGGRCAITGCAEGTVLQAAHIWPVQRGGRHAIENSVLLRADLHNLFDLGLLKVTHELRVEINPAVSDPQYAQLRGNTVSVPATCQNQR